MYAVETEIDTLTPIVARVLRIESVTSGDTSENQGYLMRYSGQLRREPSEAYEQLAADLKPRDITPLFRSEEDKHVVLLIPGVVTPRPSNPLWNLVLFLLTLASMLFTGALYGYQGPPPASDSDLIVNILRNLWSGAPFAISLLAILLAHEFGHYLMARYHRTNVTLPYFLPFPFSYFGTMGAFIQLKEPPRNKRILLDVGIAGPLAGLVVAIPVLLYGLSLSTIDRLDVLPGQVLQLEGNSILYLLSKFAIFGQWLPTPSSYESLPPLLYWVRYFFTGQPLPLGGADVLLHPVAWAGWAGLLVTALNLIPAGQLDGGHVVYGLFGSRARSMRPIIVGALLLLGFVWSGWWLWALIIFFLGRGHAEPLDQITTLDPRRRAIAILGLVIFVLLFTPVPLVQHIAGG